MRTMNNSIPLVDLHAQYESIREEIAISIQEVLESSSFILGEAVQKFEEEFADFCQTKYCVGVSNGTDALRLALLATNVGRGDKVITVPNTFIATTEAITQTGATTKFVDVDPRTYNIDHDKLDAYLKERFKTNSSRFSTKPKAIIPVHLYGQSADMDSILEIAQRYDLLVIEDACQAHGAEYKGRRTGSMGIAACFSFYPGKNLGAFGEAGAVVTNNEEVAERIRMLRDHGQMKKYYHEIEGYNARLDTIQAGVLRVKLKYLPEWNEKRRRNARRYGNLLKEVDSVLTPWEPPWSKSVYHLYVIQVKERDVLRHLLSERGISTGLHYPIPLHLQRAYQYLGYRKGAFPIAEKLASCILSLPMYPELTPEQIRYIVESLSDICRTKLAAHGQ